MRYLLTNINTSLNNAHGKPYASPVEGENMNTAKFLYVEILSTITTEQGFNGHELLAANELAQKINQFQEKELFVSKEDGELLKKCIDPKIQKRLPGHIYSQLLIKISEVVDEKIDIDKIPLNQGEDIPC